MYEVRKPIYAYVPLIASSISNTQALETLRGKESVGDRNLILIKMTEREGTRLVHYIDYTLVKYFLENYTFPNDKLRPLLVHEERCTMLSNTRKRERSRATRAMGALPQSIGTHKSASTSTPGRPSTPSCATSTPGRCPGARSAPTSTASRTSSSGSHPQENRRFLFTLLDPTPQDRHSIVDVRTQQRHRNKASNAFIRCTTQRHLLFQSITE